MSEGVPVWTVRALVRAATASPVDALTGVHSRTSLTCSGCDLSRVPRSADANRPVPEKGSVHR